MPDNSKSRFGLWTVQQNTSAKFWLCRCECGTERLVNSSDLRASKSTNCGCVRRRTLPAAAAAAARTHGMSRKTEFRIWTDMRRRCTQPHRPDYKNYGGRGIRVCDEWLNSFDAFYRDMGSRPDGCTLDRTDNDGPYSKDNCRWSSVKVQSRNSRRNVKYEFSGERMTLAEAAERFGFAEATLRSRITLYNWSPDDAVSKPVRKTA